MRPAPAPGDSGGVTVRDALSICGCSLANLCVSFRKEEKAMVDPSREGSAQTDARIDAEASDVVAKRCAPPGLSL